MNDIVNTDSDLTQRTVNGRRLENKNIILTGAAGSIGQFVTRQLLSEGARLLMTGRDIDKLRAFVELLCDEGFSKDRLFIVAGDSADPDVCRRIVATSCQ